MVPVAKSLVILIPKLHWTSPLLHLEPTDPAAVVSIHTCTIVEVLVRQKDIRPFSRLGVWIALTLRQHTALQYIFREYFDLSIRTNSQQL